MPNGFPPPVQSFGQSRLAIRICHYCGSIELESLLFASDLNGGLTSSAGARMGIKQRNVNLLLFPKRSDALDAQKMEREIGNLLTNMRRSGRICNNGARAHPIWFLAESNKS